MEDQVPSSTPPQMNQPIPGQITPDMLEQMKQQAREMAIAQHMAQQQGAQVFQGVVPSQPMAVPVEQPNVVYVRRNLTIAELLVILCVSIGIVTGFQTVWNFTSERMPQIEIRMK